MEETELFDIVQQKMQYEQWSQQQISQRLTLEDRYKSISFNTIYRVIKADLFNLPDLLGKKLLHRKGKTYKTSNYKKIEVNFP